jgi:hypothetical protein
MVGIERFFIVFQFFVGLYSFGKHTVIQEAAAAKYFLRKFACVGVGYSLTFNALCKLIVLWYLIFW